MKKIIPCAVAGFLSPLFVVGAVAFVAWEWLKYGWRTMEDLL